MPANTNPQPDPIGDKLAELAELGQVYNRLCASGRNPAATRRAMLCLVGDIYHLAADIYERVGQATLTPSADA